MGVIYKATSPSGKSYIGQTVNEINHRWRDHVYDAHNPNQDRCKLLNRAIRKYGEDNFYLETVCECENEHLNHLEEYCIKEYNTIKPFGYNLKHGGNVNVHLSETKQKISQKLKGIPKPIAVLEKRSVTKKHGSTLPMYLIELKKNGIVIGYRVTSPKFPEKRFQTSSLSLEEKLKNATEYLESNTAKIGVQRLNGDGWGINVNGTCGFGRRVTTQISRNGDLIHRVYLEVSLPATDNTVAWVDYIGLRLISDVNIEIGGQQIDKHYSDFMYIWNELSLPTGKRNGYDTMVGKSIAGSGDANPATLLHIPLEFWFCRNVGLALPLIALQYHEVKINIDFERIENLLQYGSTTLGGSGGISGDIDASLWVDYIFLDTDERRRFAQLSHEYLIEQLQFTGDESITGMNERVKLNLNHPTKELIWVVQRDAVLGLSASNDWTNYTTGSTTDPSNPGSNCVVSAKLQLNGQDRFATRDGTYFNLVQPFQHHENVSMNKGINVYSFALKPEEHQPSGTLNFSRIDTAVMQLGLAAGVPSAKIKTFAINYNVLRIMSGINCTKRTTCAKQSAANYGYCSTILDKQCKRNLVYNWLVVVVAIYATHNCNKIKLSGTPFRALTTTPVWKHTTGTQGNDLGHSKNVKDWVIRSQAPTILNALDRVKVQRIDGFGGERNAILCDPLRYIPAPCESMGVKSGEDLPIPISKFPYQNSKEKIQKNELKQTLLFSTEEYQAC